MRASELLVVEEGLVVKVPKTMTVSVKATLRVT